MTIQLYQWAVFNTVKTHYLIFWLSKPYFSNTSHMLIEYLCQSWRCTHIMCDRNRHFVLEIGLLPNTSSVSNNLPWTLTTDYRRQWSNHFPTHINNHLYSPTHAHTHTRTCTSVQRVKFVKFKKSHSRLMSWFLHLPIPVSLHWRASNEWMNEWTNEWMNKWSKQKVLQWCTMK
jgi:hypothetical protein